MTSKKASKKAVIKSLLNSGQPLTTRDIADLAQCTIQHVYKVRDELKAYQNGATLKQNFKRLDQDVRDLRALVLRHSSVLGQMTGKQALTQKAEPKSKIASIAS